MQPVNMEPQDDARKIMVAESQDEYGTLPALYFESEHLFVSHWHPSSDEIQAILEGRPIELHVYALGSHPPVNLRVNGVHYEGD